MIEMDGSIVRREGSDIGTVRKNYTQVVVCGSQRMSRRSGIRFADKDMRQLWNLRRFPFIWDHRVIPYERKTL
jgi:hypothetical protein